jgi:hypothetical protein
VLCESCGCQTKRFEIDHKIADGLRIDKTRKLTADDGELLCKDAGRDSCHGRKTAEQDVPAIARAKRREARHIGAVRPTAKINSAPFPISDRKKKRDQAAAAKLPMPPRRPLYREAKP